MTDEQDTFQEELEELVKQGETYEGALKLMQAKNSLSVPSSKQEKDAFITGVQSFQFYNQQTRGQNMNGQTEHELQQPMLPELKTKSFSTYKQSDSQISENALEGVQDISEALVNIAAHGKYLSLFREENREVVRNALVDLTTSGKNLLLQNIHYMKLQDEELVKRGTLSDITQGTFYHSVAVGALSAIIYDRMKSNLQYKEDLKNVSLSQMFSGAMMHDAGKKLIPGSELHQKSKLDDDQWNTFMWHPVDGESLLAMLGYGNGVEKDIALKHHLWPSYKPVQGEKLKSYPLAFYEKKEGDYFVADIPVHVKIVTVADGFDAMARKRSYRKDLSIQDVVLELARESKISSANTHGIHYDPTITYTLADLVIE